MSVLLLLTKQKDNKIKCPNGECEKDISECDALEECDDDEVRCQDSSCADDYESCGIYIYYYTIM